MLHAWQRRETKTLIRNRAFGNARKYIEIPFGACWQVIPTGVKYWFPTPCCTSDSSTFGPIKPLMFLCTFRYFHRKLTERNYIGKRIRTVMTDWKAYLRKILHY